MKVLGRVLVADILAALDIDALPSDSSLSTTDVVDLDDVEVDDDLARDELPEAEPEELHSRFSESDVIRLAEAVRIGDRGEAEILLDRIFGEDATVTEWIQRGRYSKRARTYRGAPALLKAA
jgi:hypothetical protein